MRRFISPALTAISLLCALLSLYFVTHTSLLVDEYNDLKAREYMVRYLRENDTLSDDDRSTISFCIQQAASVREADACIPDDVKYYWDS